MPHRRFEKTVSAVSQATFKEAKIKLGHCPNFHGRVKPHIVLPYSPPTIKAVKKESPAWKKIKTINNCKK